MTGAVRSALLALAFAALVGGSPPPPLPGPDAAAVRMADLVNAHRAARGCAALQWSDPLAAVASAHARDMWDRGYFDHDSPEGRTVDDRLRDAGIRYRGAAGENLAMAQANADHVFRLWLGSPGHRRNLQNCRHTHHGLGRHNDLWSYVLVAAPEVDGAR